MARRRLYSGLQSEPNMRQELIHMLDGDVIEISKKHPVLLRRMRTPYQDHICSCVDKITKEPDKDHFCPYCLGEGKLWDEEYIDVYSVREKSDVGNALRDRLTGPGNVNVPIISFYLKYDVGIKKADKIVTLQLDESGEVVQPPRRTSVLRIGSILEYRSDNGKLEYFKIPCYDENRKFLNSEDD